MAAVLAGPLSASSSAGWALSNARRGFRCDLQGARASADVALASCQHFLSLIFFSFAVQRRNWSPSNQAGFMGVEPGADFQHVPVLEDDGDLLAGLPASNTPGSG